MEIIKICGIALTALFAALLVGEGQKNVGFAVCTAAAVVLIARELTTLVPTVSYLGEAASGYSIYSKYYSALMKALVIACLVKITSDMCSEAGKKTVASAVEICGKIEIIALSLPLIKELAEISKSLLS